MKYSARNLFFALFLSFIFYLLFSVTSVFAQTTNPYTNPNNNPDVPKNLHTWTQNVMIEVIASLSCQLTGVDPINSNQKCLGVDKVTGQIGFVQNGGGAIGAMDKMITMLYTPPLHTGDYFNYLASNFGLAKPTYAQGVGFKGISPLMNLWKVFRNIVYLLFVIVFIIIGLAIMLRVKIDPRTVMSIQNQIPKIIIGIILVTFSFAISGFLIDMMYVGVHLSANVISGVFPTTVSINPSEMQGKTPLEIANQLQSGGIFGITNNAAIGIKDTIKPILGIDDHPAAAFNPLGVFSVVGLPGKSFFSIIIDVVSIYAGFFAGSSAANIAQSAMPSAAVAGIPAGILGYGAAQLVLREVLPWGIPYLIILIAVLFALFKLWFELLKAYIFILVNVVAAPFWIVLGLIPGSSIGFGSWLKDITANLLVFPITIIMFSLGKVFMDAANSTTGQLFVPPLVGNPAGGAVSPLSSLIGLGVILLTPQVLTMTRDIIKSPQFKYSAAIGQAIGTGSPTGLISQASQLGTSYYGITHLPGVGGLLGRFFGRGGP